MRTTPLRRSAHLTGAAKTRALLLLCAAAAFTTVAAAARTPAAAHARRLAQQGSCATFIPACAQCRFVTSGSRSRAVCTQCSEGYLVKNSGRSCWCAPGFFRTAPGVCLPCGLGFYCPGSKTTEESAARLSCGRFKNTTTTRAQSERDCLVNPGYGWGAGNSSAMCEVGWWNSGANTRRCTKCSGALTTVSPGAANPSDCVAPPGYYSMRGTAVACAQGTFKEAAGNGDCTECPEGFTTQPSSVAATSRRNCSFVEPGYQAPPNAVPGNTTATRCPQGTYRSSTAAYAADGVSCTPCPAGMSTLDDGMTSADACLVMPGYGWDRTTSAGVLCPIGTFSPGFSRDACTPCGAGSMTTDGPGMDSGDDCFVPPGHNAALANDGITLTGAPCPPDTYGVDQRSFGQVASECSKCPANSGTQGRAAQVGPGSCRTLPGYGWEDGVVEECAYGSWATGGDQSRCTECGAGYNTTDGAGNAVMGATSAAACQVDIGWQPDGSGGITPCPQGTYKATYGPAACSPCPSGTTSSWVLGATEVAQCDACLPGYGAPGPLNPAAPACSPCPSGTFNQGKLAGFVTCQACPRPSGFSGKMVSRTGAFTSELCAPEFVNDGSAPTNTLGWNLIPMDDAALTLTAAQDRAACQAACAAGAECQYFVWREHAAAGARCGLRDKVPYTPVAANDTAASIVMFEVSDGTYVTYPAHPSDAASLGVHLTALATRDAAVAACNRLARCVGIKYAAGGGGGGAPWRLFGAILWEDVVGKVKATGENLNHWVPAPASSG